PHGGFVSRDRGAVVGLVRRGVPGVLGVDDDTHGIGLLLRGTGLQTCGASRYNAPVQPTETAMPRILIADDNQPNAELLEAHLDGTGYETRISANGEDTLATARDWKPDIILLDITMPRLSGFEVCKRLRSDPATRDTAILMVTALDQPTDVEKA